MSRRLLADSSATLIGSGRFLGGKADLFSTSPFMLEAPLARALAGRIHSLNRDYCMRSRQLSRTSGTGG